MHTEFVTWTFICPLASGHLGEVDLERALAIVPQDWFANLPGQCLSSLHLWAVSKQDTGAVTLVKQVLLEDTLVASSVAGGGAEVYTDFAIHGDGFSRMLLLVGN